MFLGQASARGPADLHGLEAIARAVAAVVDHAAADVEDDLLQA